MSGDVLRTYIPFYTTQDGEYGYTPLEAGEIRLIKILACPAISTGVHDQNDSMDWSVDPDGDHCIYDDNEMHAQIVHVRVAEFVQSYCAISYCWGDDPAQRTVLVHEKGGEGEVQVLPIAATLYAALQRAWHVYLHGAPASRPTEVSRYFWADGICIRQNWDEPDDEEEDALWTKEKEAQVKLMGPIYENAASVMFDLGDDTGEGDLDVAFLMFGDIFQAVNQAAKAGRLDRRQRIEPHEYSRHGLPPPGDPKWRAWTRFMARPWFRRVWIVQEYALARAGWFLFGSQDNALPWDVLPELVTYLRLLGLDSRRGEDPGNSETERLHAHRSISAMVTQQVWRDRRKTGRKPTLLDALKNTRGLECKDARDRAYSVLAMCADVDYEHADLSVDYGKSTTVQSVFLRFTRWILQHDERAIDVLYQCGGTYLPGPSWCPSWSSRRETGSLQMIRMEKLVYAAGGGGRASVRFDTDENVVISRGFVVDRISQLGPVFTLAPDKESAQDEMGMLAWESQSRHWLLNNIWPRANRDNLLPFANMVHVYRDQARLEESYIRTLVGNNLEMGNSAADQGTAYDSLSVMRQGLDLDFGVPIRTLFRDDASYARHGKIYSDFLRMMSRLATGRRFCVTHGGSIGLVPARVRSGDAVVVLLGGDVPFTMRPENDSFVVLGECYLDGIMNGEALFDSTAPIQDIVIK